MVFYSSFLRLLICSSVIFTYFLIISMGRASLSILSAMRSFSRSSKMFVSLGNSWTLPFFLIFIIGFSFLILFKLISYIFLVFSYYFSFSIYFLCNSVLYSIILLFVFFFLFL